MPYPNEKHPDQQTPEEEAEREFQRQLLRKEFEHQLSKRIKPREL